MTVGGGMGMTHGEPDTYPRIAEVMGFCRTEDVLKVSEAVVTVQRDWGDRKNRKHARLKYTIEDRGLDAFRAEVEKRAGVKLAPAKPYTFTSTGDRYGWTEGADGRGHLTLFVQNGRVHDVPGAAQQSALRAIAQMHDGDFRITPNQNLIISNVPTEKQAEIERIAREAGLLAPWSGLRRNSMACVALPTCGLALAESERYLPELLDALDQKLAAHGLSADDIVIRMTGCPNGCARPYLAEIGLVGKGPGRYNLYLGAAFDGSRMNKLYAEDLDHAGIVAALDPLFAAYVAGRQKSERFGDFVDPRRPRRRERQRRRFPCECPALRAEIGVRSSRVSRMAGLSRAIGTVPTSCRIALGPPLCGDERDMRGLVLALQNEQGQDDQDGNKQNRGQAFPEQQRIALDQRLRRRLREISCWDDEDRRQIRIIPRSA